LPVVNDPGICQREYAQTARLTQPAVSPRDGLIRHAEHLTDTTKRRTAIDLQSMYHGTVEIIDFVFHSRSLSPANCRDGHSRRRGREILGPPSRSRESFGTVWNNAKSRKIARLRAAARASDRQINVTSSSRRSCWARWPAGF
jgi:hypothetical protein